MQHIRIGSSLILQIQQEKKSTKNRFSAFTTHTGEVETSYEFNSIFVCFFFFFVFLGVSLEVTCYTHTQPVNLQFERFSVRNFASIEGINNILTQVIMKQFLVSVQHFLFPSSFVVLWFSVRF